MKHIAHMSVPMVGELVNGDRVVVRTEGTDYSLIAVIDGLGHGPGAAAASEVAAACLVEASLEMSLLQIMELCHAKMAGTRGAAATVCLARGRTVEVCAVGNVELRSAEARLPLVFSAGLLGVRVRKFHVCQATIPPRARFVLFSDGISSRTPVDEMRGMSAGAVCDAIMQKYRRKEDDATVLVADAE